MTGYERHTRGSRWLEGYLMEDFRGIGESVLPPAAIPDFAYGSGPAACCPGVRAKSPSRLPHSQLESSLKKSEVTSA